MYGKNRHTESAGYDGATSDLRVHDHAIESCEPKAAWNDLVWIASLEQLTGRKRDSRPDQFAAHAVDEVLATSERNWQNH